tara:strand:+ start:213 stop:479 length:267 start_codon:yes stop_codon:yes gene_type:complete
MNNRKFSKTVRLTEGNVANVAFRGSLNTELLELHRRLTLGELYSRSSTNHSAGFRKLLKEDLGKNLYRKKFKKTVDSPKTQTSKKIIK